MKISNKKKIEILQKMREYILEDYSFRGLCMVYCVVTGKVGSDEALNALGLIPPKKRYSGGYWYIPKDKNSRIKLIDKTIKELSK